MLQHTMIRMEGVTWWNTESQLEEYYLISPGCHIDTHILSMSTVRWTSVVGVPQRIWKLIQDKIWHGNRIQSYVLTLQPFWVSNAHWLQVKTLQYRMFFSPAPGHFKLPTPPSTELPTDSSSSLPVIPKQKKYNEGIRQKYMIKCMMRQRKQEQSSLVSSAW